MTMTGEMQSGAIRTGSLPAKPLYFHDAWKNRGTASG